MNLHPSNHSLLSSFNKFYAALAARIAKEYKNKYTLQIVDWEKDDGDCHARLIQVLRGDNVVTEVIWMRSNSRNLQNVAVSAGEHAHLHCVNGSLVWQREFTFVADKDAKGVIDEIWATFKMSVSEFSQFCLELRKWCESICVNGDDRLSLGWPRFDKEHPSYQAGYLQAEHRGTIVCYVCWVRHLNQGKTTVAILPAKSDQRKTHTFISSIAPELIAELVCLDFLEVVHDHAEHRSFTADGLCLFCSET
jgi:hypothetical protein